VHFKIDSAAITIEVVIGQQPHLIEEYGGQR